MSICARSRSGAVALVVGAAMAFGLLAGPASAAAGTYSASISPTAATGRPTATHVGTESMPASLASLLGFNHATVQVPAGFTAVTVGAPSPSTWRASYNSET